jgi:hypothetical protein
MDPSIDAGNNQAHQETNMDFIQQPVLMASTTADNSVGMGILLVMFSVIIATVALRSLSKRSRGQWLTFRLRHNPAYEVRDPTSACTGCPAD